MHRRGGIRLHPIRDGVIPTCADPNRVKHLDRGGNTLTDITDPSTGFCMGVTSPLTIEGGPVLESTPVVPVHNPKRDYGLVPQYDSATGVWWMGTGSNRRVIRLVSDGDQRLSSMPPRRGATKRPNGPQRGAQRAAGTTTPRPTGNGPDVEITRDMIDAFIVGMHKKACQAKGKTPPPLKITKYMRKMARLEIQRQQDIQKYCAK